MKSWHYFLMFRVGIDRISGLFISVIKPGMKFSIQLNRIFRRIFYWISGIRFGVLLDIRYPTGCFTGYPVSGRIFYRTSGIRSEYRFQHPDIRLGIDTRYPANLISYPSLVQRCAFFPVGYLTA